MRNMSGVLSHIASIGRDVNGLAGREPGPKAAPEMLVHVETCSATGLDGRARPDARRAGEHDPAIVRQGSGIELRQRHGQRAGDHPAREFVGFAHVDDQDRAVVETLADVARFEIDIGFLRQVPPRNIGVTFASSYRHQRRRSRTRQGHGGTFMTGDWQSIDTVPKDTEVLVHTKPWGAIIASYSSEFGEWLSRMQVPVSIRDENELPTHWLPLPGPPDESRPAG